MLSPRAGAGPSSPATQMRLREEARAHVQVGSQYNHPRPDPANLSRPFQTHEATRMLRTAAVCMPYILRAPPPNPRTPERGHSGCSGRRPSRGWRRWRARARSHCRFIPPLIHFIPYSLTYSVPLFLKRQCDRTLGGAAAELREPARRAADRRPAAEGGEGRGGRGRGQLLHGLRPPGPPGRGGVRCVWSFRRHCSGA